MDKLWASKYTAHFLTSYIWHESSVDVDSERGKPGCT
jgi:hypothetical protein